MRNTRKIRTGPLRHLSCPKPDWPVHDPRTVVLPGLAWDRRYPPHFVLGPWVQSNQRWYSWSRSLRPRSRYRQVLVAAHVWVNGGGLDNEYRFIVRDHRTDPPTEVGGVESTRAELGAEFVGTPTGQRLYSGRGIFPAQPGDVPVLMAFCDRLLSSYYPEEA